MEQRYRILLWELGTLIFSSSVQLDPGPVDNVSLEVNYNDGTINETFVADNLSTYVKGQAPFMDVPPLATQGSGTAYLGESMASGDFNCDGYEDLAVGMPKASHRTLWCERTSGRRGCRLLFLSKAGFNLRVKKQVSLLRLNLQYQVKIRKLLPLMIWITIHNSDSVWTVAETLMGTDWA